MWYYIWRICCEHIVTKMKNIILSADDTTIIPMCVCKLSVNRISACEECGGDCFVSAPDIYIQYCNHFAMNKDVVIVSKECENCEDLIICRNRARFGGMIRDLS